jgi:hypothetical protein
LVRKQKEDALEQLAELMALAALQASAGAERAEDRGANFSDRDINFAKLFAQKVTRAGTPAIALVASMVGPSRAGICANFDGRLRSSRHGCVAQAGVVVHRRARRWKPRFCAGRNSGGLRVESLNVEQLLQRGSGYNRKLMREPARLRWVLRETETIFVKFGLERALHQTKFIPCWNRG